MWASVETDNEMKSTHFFVDYIFTLELMHLGMYLHAKYISANICNEKETRKSVLKHKKR